jgi:hypothetical protein
LGGLSFGNDTITDYQAPVTGLDFLYQAI